MSIFGALEDLKDTLKRAQADIENEDYATAHSRVEDAVNDVEYILQDIQDRRNGARL